MLQITLLTDDSVRKRGLLAEHGLSLWIESDRHKIVFDTGQTDVYLKNAQMLGLDLEQAQAIVISHGHYDHGGGLAWFPLRESGPRVYLHPEATLPKFGLAKNLEEPHRPVGLPWRIDQIKHLDQIVTHNTSTLAIADNLYLCAEIPVVTDFEPVNTSLLVEKNDQVQVDAMHDEQVLVCTCKKGLVVVVGCSHPGIVNILKYVHLFFSEQPIHAVIGGMHLENASPIRLQQTIDYFRQMGITKVVPLHCTGSQAVWTMKQQLGDVVVTACTGDTITLELSDKGQIESAAIDYLDKAIIAMKKIPAKGEPETDTIAPAEETAPASAQGSTQEVTVKKIAIAAEGHSVCEHFGHCEGFNIYTTQNGAIIAQDFLANPGHKPGLLPNLLNDQGVHVVIAGGMGAGAIDIFNEKGIDVITGARGMVDQTIATYLDGKLLSTGSVCHDHQHAGDCGGH